MSEELTNLTTDEDIEFIIDDNIETEDVDQNLEIEETVEIIEVETVEDVNIEVDEAIGWVGGDSTRHYSLYGREEPDQHPITAITGLREELNDIEALDVVYSNERNQANYYLWEDENILQENRVGYFVSACDDINKIKMCTLDNDIFGVTVDSAGFIGAQSDIARDIKYGLVVTTGIVHVRCELSVEEGDYVISNDYGCAQKNKNGYKVVGRHKIDGVEYAEITLAAPINRICKLSDDVENVNQRMDDAEFNIVSAINVANAAYNKAGEVADISEEAVKNALEALGKVDGVVEDIDEMEEDISSVNQTAVQAKALAESAIVSADAIRNEAVKTANDALADVNDLIKDLEPITTWSDPGTGNVGAEYFTTYVKDGVATKAEIQTVENLTKDNKSAIEKSAKEFSSFISSVDKYSVGEYSQSYGLTHEQATSILKIGMVYVPTKHSDSKSHSEKFEDTNEVNEFTPGSYYEWNGSDWIEHTNSVAFFSEEPIPNRVLKYWYIDSSSAPEGYEPYTLYVYKDDKWVKVNIFYNNPNNRMVSSISQEVDNISLEITNARGSSATLTERIDDNEATIQGVVNWTKDPDGNQYNLATIQQTADDAGASVSLVVAEKDGEKVVNAASIVTAINEGDSSVVINADHVDISGVDIGLKGRTINLTADDITIKSDQFSVNPDGYMNATGGTIGGWKITENLITDETGEIDVIPANIQQKIPENYTLLKSITSDGSGYIDLEIVPQVNPWGGKPYSITGFSIDCKINEDTGTILGAVTSGNKLALTLNGDASTMQLSAWEDTLNSLQYESNYRHQYEFIDGNYKSTASNETYHVNYEEGSAWGWDTDPETLYLFGCHRFDDSSMVENLSKVTLYELIIYNSIAPIAHFYPCLDDSLNVGVYDIINQKFHPAQSVMYDAPNNFDYEEYVTVPKEATTTLDSTTGTITTKNLIANGGNIGGWSLVKDIKGSNYHRTALYAKPIDTDQPTIGLGTGMATIESVGSPAFWAGYSGNGDTPWDYVKESSTDKWEKHTNFYVTNAGYLYANWGHFGNSVIIGSDDSYTQITANDLKQLYRATQGLDGYGNISVKRINAIGGSVGGWKIGTDSISTTQSKVNSYLYANGNVLFGGNYGMIKFDTDPVRITTASKLLISDYYSATDMSSNNDTISIRAFSGTVHINSNNGVYANDNLLSQGSARSMKENIKLLTETEIDELYTEIRELPLYSYDYKQEYCGGQKNHIGIIIEDFEDKKLAEVLHVVKNNEDKNVKSYSHIDLSLINLMINKELMKKVQMLENQVLQFKALTKGE